MIVTIQITEDDAAASEVRAIKVFCFQADIRHLLLPYEMAAP